MKNRLILLIVGGFIVFLLIGVISLITLNFMIEEEPFKTYQFSNFNTLTNSTSFGFVKMSKELSEVEFISYRSKNNIVYSSISKAEVFSSKSSKFEFHATCHCATDGNSNNHQKEIESSRRSVQVLSKTLYFIVSAISLTMAMKIAKDYFTEQCFLLSIYKRPTDIDEFADDDKFQDATNDDCSREDMYPELEKVMGEEEIARMKGHGIAQSEYDCTGHCVPAEFIYEDAAIEARDAMNCESKFQEKTVIFSHLEGDNPIELVKIGFVQDSLVPFCREESLFTFDYKHKVVGEFKDTVTQEVTVPLCEGFAPDGFGNVQCEPSKTIVK